MLLFFDIFFSTNKINCYVKVDNDKIVRLVPLFIFVCMCRCGPTRVSGTF